MSKSKIIALQLVLLAIGTVAWAWQSRSFQQDGKLAHEPNLLHLKRSPFGRTLALAMRGPVDVYWHRGGVHDHGEGHEHAHGEHDHDCDCDCGDHEGHGHGHDHSHDHSHGSESASEVLVARLEEMKEHAHDHGPGESDPAQEAVAEEKEFTGVRTWMLDRI